LIPEVQMVIATCWKENPNERMRPLNLFGILNGSKAKLVKEETRKTRRRSKRN